MKKFLLSVFIFIITLSFTTTDITFAKEKLNPAEKKTQLETKKKARAEKRAQKKAEMTAKRKARKEELARKKAERAAKLAAKKPARKKELAQKKATGKVPLWMPWQDSDRYLCSARDCLNRKKFADARVGAAYVVNNYPAVEKKLEAMTLLEHIDASETAYTASKKLAAKTKKPKMTKAEKLEARKNRKEEFAQKKAEKEARLEAKRKQR
ncbi:MAG: hypothetical protein WBC74_02750, partial [Candidatus Omnitrophota bacterium]